MMKNKKHDKMNSLHCYIKKFLKIEKNYKENCKIFQNLFFSNKIMIIHIRIADKVYVELI